MAISRRDQSKEKLWRYRINRQRSSGLTVPQFCVREMLNEHNFRSWQATIKTRDEENERKSKESAQKKHSDKRFLCCVRNRIKAQGRCTVAQNLLAGLLYLSGRRKSGS